MSIVATIAAVASAIIAAAQFTHGIIQDMRQTRQNLQKICNTDMQAVWKSVSNVDSEVFQQRMTELDNDIQAMLDTLDEYYELLNKSAQEYERTQSETKARASQLQSPRNR